MSSAVQDKETLLQRLINHQSDIRSFGVDRLGIFGSFAKGSAVHPGSDVDFFVEFEQNKKTFDNFMELSFFLETLLGRKVEIVTPQSLNKYIGPKILTQVENVIC